MRKINTGTVRKENQEIASKYFLILMRMSFLKFHLSGLFYIIIVFITRYTYNIFLSSKCKDIGYDDEFVRSNPDFRGYTKDNCNLLQQQNTRKLIYNCSLVYDKSVNNGRYCSPLEHMKILNPEPSFYRR